MRVRDKRRPGVTKGRVADRDGTRNSTCDGPRHDGLCLGGRRCRHRRPRIAGCLLGDKPCTPAQRPSDQNQPYPREPDAFCSHVPTPHPFKRSRICFSTPGLTDTSNKPSLPEVTMIPFVTNRPIVGATLGQIRHRFAQRQAATAIKTTQVPQAAYLQRGQSNRAAR